MPVTTTSRSRGISTSTFWRLFSRAPRIWMVVRILDVEHVRRLFDSLGASFGQLERGGKFLQQPLALQPLAGRLQVPRVDLRKREMIAHLRQRDQPVLLFEIVQQRLQVGFVVLVEIPVDRVEGG